MTKSGLNRTHFETTLGGKKTVLLALTNDNGIEICATNYGARIVSWIAPDRDGNMADIVLGHDTIAEYLAKPESYFGAAIGRYANRIANGRFTLDGVDHVIPQNNGANALHGGPAGFESLVWDARQPDNSTLEFRLRSEDGDQGFPGNLDVTMTYTLTPANELRIDYRAIADKPTVVNLTNHSFFNLGGAGGGGIAGHIMRIFADHYTPVTPALIPTGEIAPVAGTPFDFRKPEPVGTRIDTPDNEQLKNAGGYDHNYVINRSGPGLRPAAKVLDPQSGRVLEVFTTQPGVQLYTGNFIDGKAPGKGGKTYGYRSALCLETQHFPDSPNRKNFPTTILRPGEIYAQTSVYKVSVE